jgi:hypothetical protein
MKGSNRLAWSNDTNLVANTDADQCIVGRTKTFAGGLFDVRAGDIQSQVSFVVAIWSCSKFQRGKELEAYSYIDGHYLLPVDGTGFFSSSQVHCDNCCEKHHRDGHTTYYHQMLGAALVHPDICEVIPFILGVKPKGNVALFNWADGVQMQTYEFHDASGSTHKFEWLNDIHLNDSCDDLHINFLKYWGITPNGKKQHFSWVTDFLLSEETVYKIMRGGRARWKIKNETFNTLKNQGYHFDHRHS